MTTAANFTASDPELSKLTGEQLRVRVARAQLYLIDMAPFSPPSQEQQREHFAYLYKLEQEGRLYGAGPVDFTEGQPLHGLAIVAAASRAEAEKIAENEPFHKAGVRKNSVRGHTMNEGVACYIGRAMAKRVEAMGETFDPDSTAAGFSLDAFRAGAAGAHLFLVTLDPTSKVRPPEDTATMDAHFLWLRDNEMSARLMSCGPVEPPSPLAPGVWGGGLGIVATSREDAKRLAMLEPSGQAGYRALSVRSWTLNFGLAAPIGRALETLNHLPS